MALTLYGVSDGPPTMAVMQALAYLDLKYKFVTINYAIGEHMTEEYAQKNPQKEMPVLDDNGFFLSESNAILQYLADKYPKNETLYPKNVQARAIVNHRLCFNLSTYYRYICEYALEPIFFTYERTQLRLKRALIALEHLNTYFSKLGGKYATGDKITIADFQLATTTMCLEAINCDISGYPLIQRWYNMYKVENPTLWRILEHGMNQLAYFEKNPPVLASLDHPIHPVRKN
ncbi:unnamed protein product [Acanthoscelides obtectus]|uniref:Glutathione S-transferase 1 n=1 Tax=Acanthoscelides obtectus TaxID=200917 RepID=A0A9P0P2J6_ACAOB|nr:unnamed protein product [Acanthoscelides obtectus]CAK1655331.1 Glutathione S-transferase 1, isoform D [Acanthoscelides obtectus]